MNSLLDRSHLLAVNPLEQVDLDFTWKPIAAIFDEQLSRLRGNNHRRMNVRVPQSTHPLQLGAKLVVRVIANPMQAKCMSTTTMVDPEDGILPILNQGELRVIDAPHRQCIKAGGLQAESVVNLMRENGILMSNIGEHDNVLKLRPPLCFSSENADQLLSTLDDVLRTI